MNQFNLFLWAISFCSIPISLYLKKENWFYAGVVAFLFLSIGVMIAIQIPNPEWIKLYAVVTGG